MLKVELEEKDLQYIVNVLASQPYNQVADLIANIHKQVVEKQEKKGAK